MEIKTLKPSDFKWTITDKIWRAVEVAKNEWYSNDSRESALFVLQDVFSDQLDEARIWDLYERGFDDEEVANMRGGVREQEWKTQRLLDWINN